MGSIVALLQIVVQRSLANWKLLTTVALGVVLSSALMASVIIYSDAVRDLGLSYAIRNAEPLDLHVRVVSTSQKAQPEVYAHRRATTVETVERKTRGFLDELVVAGRSATFFLTAPGETVPDDDLRPRAHFLFSNGVEDHVRVVEGRAPEPAEPAPPGSAPALEVWLGREAAEQLGVAVGDTFDLHPFWALDLEPVHVTVVGLIEPLDPADPYFFAREGRFAVTTTSWPTYPFWTSERDLIDAVAAYLPAMDGTFETYAFLDFEKINARNAPQLEADLNALAFELRRDVQHTAVETKLPTLIATYQDKLFFTRLPLFALMLLIVGIALYYLVIVATMVVERQAGEIALLKSRGAGLGQIMAVYAVEGLLVVAFAVLAGPYLASWAIRLLGPTPSFEALSEGKLLETTLSLEAFGMAALGAFLALLATLWPAFRAAGRSIIHYKQHLARPPQQPVFLRYYLDLGLVGVGAFAFYQLRQRGSLVTESLFGDLSADPLLLVSPGLFMLMIALVFLRLFPVALSAVAWAAHGLRGATIPLALWRMVRAPLHYSRLILLLILATAVGMFAAGFGATLDRSYEDRAAYRAGAPLRIVEVRAPGEVIAPEFAAIVEEVEGVEGVVPVARTDGSYNISDFVVENFEVLGVPRDEFAGVAYWRSDFGAASLESLLEKVAPPEGFTLTRGATIPAGTRYVGLWMQSSLPPRNARPEIRLVDADGVYWEYRMGTFAPPIGGWYFYVTDLERPAPAARYRESPDLSRPLTFDAVYVRIGGVPVTAGPAGVAFDDLQYFAGDQLPEEWDGAGFGEDGVVIEPFESLDPFETITGVSVRADPGALSRVATNNDRGEFAAGMAFTYEAGVSPIIGLRIRRPEAPLPLLASTSFLKATGIEKGVPITIRINRQYLDAVVVDDFQLFPGFDPGGRRHLVVADIEALSVAATRVPGLATGIYPNEVWAAAGPPGITIEDLQAQGVIARELFDQAAIHAELSSDPLIGASWEGILFLSFATVLVLTALGFIVFSYLAAQTRSLEFAILRTMGFSGRQILGVVAFEQCFVIVAGVAAGTLLGFPLGRLLIDSLSLTEDGSEVIPPLVSEVSWTTVLTVYGLLGMVFVATVAALVALYSRLALHRTLRMGEL
ncbi:MAG: ABC transporter permease [Dehalococcoidia bacterium]